MEALNVTYTDFTRRTYQHVDQFDQNVGGYFDYSPVAPDDIGKKILVC